MLTGKHLRLTVAVSAIMLIAAACGSRPVRAAGLDVVDHLPAEPMVAGTFVFDPAEMIETWVNRMGAITGEDEGKMDALYDDLDEKLGFSFEDDVLGAFGPEFGFAIATPEFSKLVALVTASDMTGITEELVLVAKIDGRDRAVRAIEGLAGLGESELTVEEDRLTLAIGGSDGQVLHGRIGRKLLVLSGTAERAEEALRGYPAARSLAGGADFARVSSHVDPDAETLTYINLPQIRDLLQQAKDDPALDGMFGANLPDTFLQDEWMGIGLIQATARTDGGLRSTRFGPEAIAGGTSPLNAAAFSSGMMMYLGQALSEFAKQVKPSAKSKRAMADLRSIGTAIEEFSIDNDFYPTTSGWSDLSGIEEDVSPMYIRQLPMQDPWGNRYQVWSDGQSYTIVSPGSDGRLARDWLGEPVGGKSSDPAADLVFSNGSFLTWFE